MTNLERNADFAVILLIPELEEEAATEIRFFFFLVREGFKIGSDEFEGANLTRQHIESSVIKTRQDGAALREIVQYAVKDRLRSRKSLTIHIDRYPTPNAFHREMAIAC